MHLLIPTIQWWNDETNAVGKIQQCLQLKWKIFVDRKWPFLALNILSSITYARPGFCGTSRKAHPRQEIDISQHVPNYHTQSQKLFPAVIDTNSLNFGLVLKTKSACLYAAICRCPGKNDSHVCLSVIGNHGRPVILANWPRVAEILGWQETKWRQGER